MTVVLNECPYLKAPTVLRIQRLFFNKWLTINSFNKNAAQKFVNFIHTSPLMEIVVNKMNESLEKISNNLYYDQDSKNSLIKYCRFLEIFGYNDQNLIILKSSSVMTVVMSIIEQLYETREDGRADNIEH